MLVALQNSQCHRQLLFYLMESSKGTIEQRLSIMDIQCQIIHGLGVAVNFFLFRYNRIGYDILRSNVFELLLGRADEYIPFEVSIVLFTLIIANQLVLKDS